MTQFDWFLDKIRPKDKDAFVEHFRDPEIHAHTLNIPFPYTEKDADEWVRRKAKETKDNGTEVAFAIRRRDGYLIGSVGFDGLHIGKTHAAEIGYWLATEYWNQGIMSAAVKEICRIGFEEFGLVRIQARVFPGNLGSARVLEKCGFKQEGYLHKCELKDGKYLDVKLYALVR